MRAKAVEFGAWSKLLSAALVAVCGTLGDPALPAARAAHWMFQPSYYSHDLPPEVAARFPRPVSRSAYRPALAGTQPGFAIRGAARLNRIQFFSGQSNDTLYLWEGWFNERP